MSVPGTRLRRLPCRLAILAMLAVADADAARAQAPTDTSRSVRRAPAAAIPLPVGARVRVWTRSASDLAARPRVGSYAGSDSAALRLVAAPDDTVRVAMSELSGVEVSGGRTGRRTGVWVGAVVAGTLAAAVVGHAASENPRNNVLAYSTLAFAMWAPVGALTGAIVTQGRRGERWEPVPGWAP